VNQRSVSACLGLALVLGACRAAAYEWHGTAYDPPRPAPSIQLPASDGTLFDLSAEAGRVVVVYFGYINCPDICPATLGNLAALMGDLGERASGLRVAFITVDPERDTLPALADYLLAFDPTFIGLRGERPETERILAAYGVYAGMDEAAASHEIEHSARLFLVDKDGNLLAHYLWDAARPDLLADLEHALADGG
jgi:protein SCO1/2